MIRLVFAGFLAALVLAAPGAAQAPPESVTLELMKQLCFPFRGQPGQSLAAADSAGWAPASRKIVPEPPLEMADGGFRFRSTRKAASYLYAGVGASPYDRELKLSYCAISSFPESHRQTLKAVEAWVGVPAREVTAETRIYSFIYEADGTRRDADPEGAVFGRAGREGRAGMLFLAGDEESVFILLLSAGKTRDA